MTAYKDVPEAIIMDPEREMKLVESLLHSAAQAISTYVFMSYPGSESAIRARIADIELIAQHAKEALADAMKQEPQA